MTSRRGKSTSRRGRGVTISRRDVKASRRDVAEKVFQELFDALCSALCRELSTCSFIPGIEHAVRPAPTLPGPEIKPTKRNVDHEHD